MSEADGDPDGAEPTGTEDDRERVLVVEDDPDTAKMLQRRLESLGLAVQWASHGQEAILVTQNHLPGLVVMDVMMPRLDGFETTRYLRNGVKDVRELIRRLNPVLRGWGNYFRTGNAARKFNQLDSYVYRRLRQFLVRRKGRNLRAGEFRQWTRDFFWGLGLHRLRGTVRYPGAA